MIWFILWYISGMIGTLLSYFGWAFTYMASTRNSFPFPSPSDICFGIIISFAGLVIFVIGFCDLCINGDLRVIIEYFFPNSNIVEWWTSPIYKPKENKNVH